MHNLLERVARQRTAALMGIVNVTPNSFYDGGCYEAPEAGRQRVVTLLAEGADILDIGGESSKPGAAAVSASEQISRITPALDEALARGALISIDTASAEVAEHALARGAHMINDVTCLSDPELAVVVARHDAHLIVSHARGHQSQMGGFSSWPDDAYRDVAAEVRRELEAARDIALGAGVLRERVWFDPGLGFSKNARHCLELMAHLDELLATGAPLLVGTGRKSFIQAVDGSGPRDRLGGTIAASLWASRQGAHAVRVHDVAAVRQALLMEAALVAQSSRGGALQALAGGAGAAAGGDGMPRDPAPAAAPAGAR